MYLLAWIPESLLNERGKEEWEKFVRIEERSSDVEDEGAPYCNCINDSYLTRAMAPDIVLIDLPVRRPETYAFSVPLTQIYSLIVNPPSLSSWRESSIHSFL